MTTKRFSDFSKGSENLEGDKIPITDVFNKEIELLNVRFFPSKVAKGKTCSQIQFMLDGEKYVSFTTSEVLHNQLQEYKDELPFLTTLKRRGKYHTLT